MKLISERIKNYFLINIKREDGKYNNGAGIELKKPAG
jgi:hypothetical protein